MTVSSSPETSSRKITHFCLSSIQNEYYTLYVLLCGHCIHNLEYFFFFFVMKSIVVFLLLHKQNCLKKYYCELLVFIFHSRVFVNCVHSESTISVHGTLLSPKNEKFFAFVFVCLFACLLLSFLRGRIKIKESIATISIHFTKALLFSRIRFVITFSSRLIVN